MAHSLSDVHAHCDETVFDTDRDMLAMPGEAVETIAPHPERCERRPGVCFNWTALFQRTFRVRCVWSTKRAIPFLRTRNPDFFDKNRQKALLFAGFSVIIFSCMHCRFFRYYI